MDDIPRDKQKLAERCAQELWTRDTASRSLGMRIDQIGPGHAIFSMPVRDDMVNGYHVCHGGFIFSLADTTFAFACNTHDEPGMAAAADITFVQPALAGDVLRAEAREIMRKGRNSVTDVRVFNQKGETIALLRGKSRTLGGRILPDT